MQNMVKVPFSEVAQIVGDHLTQKGKLAPEVSTSVIWHCDRFGVEGSYVVFEQGEVE